MNIYRSHRNYVIITPPISRFQIVFSKCDWRWISFQVRSYTDYLVLQQTFCSEDYNLQGGRGEEIIGHYEKIVSSGLTPLIIDCGANIGLSSYYFALHFPKARIIAVEPDLNNITQAKSNCQLSSVTYIHAGIASKIAVAILSIQSLANGDRHLIGEDGSLEIIPV